MEHEQIVNQYLQRQLRAGTCQTVARKPTQAPKFFEVRKHNFDRLTAQSIDRFGFCRLHPRPMCHDEVFVFAASKATTTFLAAGALDA